VTGSRARHPDEIAAIAQATEIEDPAPVLRLRRDHDRGKAPQIVPQQQRQPGSIQVPRLLFDA
jgi:hypothetical protein